VTHDHGTHAHAHASGGTHSHAPVSESTALSRAFALTAVMLVVEGVGGLLIGSVALIADAGHMLTDVGALGIALFAAWAAAQPRGRRHSFGYGRAEVLAALLNGFLLGGVSVGIAGESIARLGAPRAIDPGPMIGIAALGLVANLLSGFFLLRGARTSLNVRAALFHVAGDAAGSLAALGAGAAILFLGWTSADAIAGILIAGLLVISALRLIRDSVHILLEGAPRHLDLEEVARRVRAVQGVARIHDLHIWTVASGFPAMSAHVDLVAGADPELVRRAVHRLLHQEYDVAHTTIQTESAPPLLQVDAPPL
jgi:cobalt-zinc-cadmium efflux system protein